MQRYPWVIVIGLLWTGPGWADRVFFVDGVPCDVLGTEAAIAMKVRDAGMTLERHNAISAALSMPETARAAIQAARQAGYLSTDTPAATRANVEALCRAGSAMR